MGYDMYTVVVPDGEAQQVEEIRKQFFAAARIRDTLSSDDPTFLFAQDRVVQLHELLRNTQKSYFRLNIWGMGRFRQAMHELGMAYACDLPGQFPPWPQGRLGQIAEALLEQEDPADYLAKYGRTAAEKAAPTDTEIAAVRARQEQAEALLRSHPGDTAGIPLYKFGSNDGWIVTPAECMDALAAWYRASDEQRERALANAGIDDIEYWNAWLDYLHRACFCEGFAVH
ncbi:hypothetical protein BJY16_001797 [Actinoplanes octamycinicus]|uniref:Uncharacterized protein n=1 Tax=Actinoplanes octamycinicus TaxID=135948 RepID=A0A7W7GU57_9ACTN|nr:hypothetical protein [Actinoplanes octamycinicus]MBB4738338.1 hypothetical protein [Actinoplanes octamycinicus]GIE57455.1 hypothetical protein Aoc01nite_28570 [Actinoplanes octamycinicus]